jgi:hypothetical protein
MAQSFGTETAGGLVMKPTTDYLAALNTLHGRRARQHLHELDRDGLVKAIREMADSGVGDYTISHATGLSVEQVRAIIGARS